MFNTYLFFEKASIFKYVNINNVIKYNYNIYDKHGHMVYNTTKKEFQKHDIHVRNVNSHLHLLIQQLKIRNMKKFCKNFYCCDDHDLEYPFNNVIDRYLTESTLYFDLRLNSNEKKLFCSNLCYGENENFIKLVHKDLLERKLSIMKILSERFTFNLIWIYMDIVHIINNNEKEPLFLDDVNLTISTDCFKDSLKQLDFGTRYYIDIPKRFIRRTPF